MRIKALDCIGKFAESDERVCFIGSDLGHGTLSPYFEKYPDRFFMEGISEAHIVGMAAGLAKEGRIVFVNTIANFFTRRAFEQICIDVAMHQFPVHFVANGGGLVYAPLGPTHTATDDIALMRSIPNMTVMAPCDALEMEEIMNCCLELKGPSYIRVAKGFDPIVSDADDTFDPLRGIVVDNADSHGVCIIETGVMRAIVNESRQSLARQGIGVGHVHLPSIKPIDDALVKKLAIKYKLLVTVEEHYRIGGLGDAVFDSISRAELSSSAKLVKIGLPDRFISEYGSQASLWESFGLDADQIAEKILRLLATS